jgi:hypothetical protein
VFIIRIDLRGTDADFGRGKAIAVVSIDTNVEALAIFGVLIVHLLFEGQPIELTSCVAQKQTQLTLRDNVLIMVLILYGFVCLYVDDYRWRIKWEIPQISKRVEHCQQLSGDRIPIDRISVRNKLISRSDLPHAGCTIVTDTAATTSASEGTNSVVRGSGV